MKTETKWKSDKVSQVWPEEWVAKMENITTGEKEVKKKRGQVIWKIIYMDIKITKNYDSIAGEGDSITTVLQERS